MLQLQEIMPKTMTDLLSFCDTLSNSGLVPTTYRGKKNDVLVALLKGAEIGLSPMSAIDSICVINGRAVLWGDAPLALVKNSGKLASIKESCTGSIADKTFKATCHVKAKDGHEQEHVWTYARAEKAGLIKKDSIAWEKYPERMLQLKARAWCLRDVFPEVLKGLGIQEDLEGVEKVVKSTKRKGAEAFISDVIESTPLLESEFIDIDISEPDEESEFPFSRDELIEKMKNAKNKDDLDEASDLVASATHLTDHDRNVFRDIFRLKKAEIIKQ